MLLPAHRSHKKRAPPISNHTTIHNSDLEIAPQKAVLSGAH